ncbi:MAG: tyrosine recombinase XerD, partial [Mycoplasmataceae bacterium RC_NB112A]
LASSKLIPYQLRKKTTLFFLNRVRYDLKISASIELAPHTLRRCFATYNVGIVPLDVLQKILGHSRISTTDLYVRDSDIARLLKYKPI